MPQMDLFADFLDQAWETASFDVSAIEKHPNMQTYQLVAYQELLNWRGNGQVDWYHIITQGHGKNPYHFGTAPLSLDRLCIDAIDQQFMLTHPDRWRLKPWHGDKDVQWTPWVWKNSEAEEQFMRWHTDRFMFWTKEAWEAAKKRGALWRPSKEEQ